MKKFILFSASLAVLASCSSDDLELPVVQSAETQSLDIRPSMGNVIISTESETRAALNPGSMINWTPEEGDKLGVALIDYPAYYYASGRTGDFATDYWIQDQIFGNYPYVKGTSGWTSQANLVEGNYLLYFPYNPNMLTREAPITKLPTIQDVSDDLNIVDNMINNKDGVIYQVGYAALVKGTSSTTLKANMKSLYATPKFTIKNDFAGYLFNNEYNANNTVKDLVATAKYSGEITVDSIQVYSPSYIPAQYNIYNYGIRDYLNDNEDYVGVGNLHPNRWSQKQYESARTWDLIRWTPDCKFASNVNEPSKLPAFTSDETEHITYVLNQTLAQGKSVSFVGLYPADAFGQYNLMARVFITVNGKHYLLDSQALPTLPTKTDVLTKYVLTPGNVEMQYKNDKGVAQTPASNTLVSTAPSWIFDDVAHGNKDGVTLLPGQMYPAAEIFSDGSGKKSFAGDLLTISMKNQMALELDPKKAAPGIVYAGITNNQELLDIVDKYDRYVDLYEVGQGVKPGMNEFQVNPTNTIEINAALIDALYARNYNTSAGVTKGSLTLTTIVRVAADVTADFSNLPSVEFKSIKSGKSYSLVLPVNTISGTTDIITEGYYYAAAGADLNTVKAGIKGYVHLFNEAGSTLTINSDFNKVSSLVNNGTLVIAGDIESDVEIYTPKTATVIINPGILVTNPINNEGYVLNDGRLLNNANVNNNTIIVGNADAITKVAAGKGEIVNDAQGRVSANATQTVTWSGAAAALPKGKALGITDITLNDVTLSTKVSAMIANPVDGCTIKSITFENATEIDLVAASCNAGGKTLIIENNCLLKGDDIDVPTLSNVVFKIKKGVTVSCESIVVNGTQTVVKNTYDGKIVAKNSTATVNVK